MRDKRNRGARAFEKRLLRFTSEIPWRGREEGEPYLAGYVRVSTEGQTTQRQVDDLVKYGVAPVDIWGDNMTGATMVRPGWEDCKRNLQPGDILVLHSLDRLSRNLVDTMTTLGELNARGVSVKVLTMDFDSRTPMGRFVFSMMAAFAQFEREVMNERSAHGLQRAREAGRIGGGTRLHSPEVIADLYAKAKGKTSDAKEKAVATQLKVAQITVKRRLAEWRKAQSEEKKDG